MSLVLVRHGESEWNAQNLFCGWVDVDLAASAITDTKRASQMIAAYMPSLPHRPRFDICYCSVLKRSIKTAHSILEALDELYIPVKKTWRLNERFYGKLTGESKMTMVQMYGKEQIKRWRRSAAEPPPPMDRKHALHPIHDCKYYRLPDFNISTDFPDTEALSDVIQRIKPLWVNELLPLLRKQTNIFLSIHGTSLRAIVALIEQKHQTDVRIDIDELSKVEIPNGYPVIYRFDEKGKLRIEANDKTWIEKQQNILEIPKLHCKFMGDLDGLLMAQNEVKEQIENKQKL